MAETLTTLKARRSCRAYKPEHVEDEKLRNARLKLVSMTKKTLKDSLALLGIDCPEQM